ncbi:ribonuclease E activity regulator RraA [Consotaella salsifontis]|uniref:4-hydroxy-4-methyl-2-oxoglutarate aldolase n=1 Tax=Consotaella salsifontis TaxID=1365950 RepID=A0A1T4Q231_9HYPH|nr:ribonuclease E activity regulator RraA [Consotaella salsifontis]SJZ97676.1 regulator of ribonuclease activity A [Consotaella salsifontis]
MTIVTADLYDQHHAVLQVCELQFRSFGKRSSLAGPCSTLSTFEDHTPVLEALSEPGNGRVLVVDGRGSLRVGIMGDRLAKIGADNGWAGLVIHGAIRDSAGINALDLAVKALGTTARRGWTAGPSARDVTLRFGGATFEPGHWIYADEDCVLTSPRQLDATASSAPPSS